MFNDISDDKSCQSLLLLSLSTCVSVYADRCVRPRKLMFGTGTS